MKQPTRSSVPGPPRRGTALLPALLTAVHGKMAKVSGNGSYDKRKCYASIGHYQARTARVPVSPSIATVKRPLTSAMRIYARSGTWSEKRGNATVAITPGVWP